MCHSDLDIHNRMLESNSVIIINMICKEKSSPLPPLSHSLSVLPTPRLSSLEATKQGKTDKHIFNIVANDMTEVYNINSNKLNFAALSHIFKT